MGQYIVSARKYRPITFESVVGQSHITSTLRNAILRGQLAHAYLFCGPRGVGKTTCARILAKSINCMNPDDQAQPCDRCESCLAFNQGRSFNIHELDAASNNSVEYIRALTDQVRIPPQIGKYSIYIIDEAHMLSTTAFNAFLKTLEEPPAHALFILATTEKHKIIPTILSRCQIYDFRRIKIDDMVSYLRSITINEKISTDDESLHMIAQKADGCMRDALSMFDKVVSFCNGAIHFKQTAEALNILDYDTYFQFVDFYASGSYAEALLLYDNVLQKGFDAQIFLGGLNAHLRNLLVALSGNTHRLLEVTGSVADRYIAQATLCKLSFLYDSMNIVSQTETTIKQSSSARLHAELAILRLCNLSPTPLSSNKTDQSYALPAPSPQPPTTNSQPVAEQQPSVPIAAPVVAQHTKEKPQEATSAPKKSSRLGVSISSILDESVSTIEKKEEKLPEQQQAAIITPENSSNVLDACKKYAMCLMDNRPRLAMAFEKAKIEDGVIELVVANDILSDEILNQKHDLLIEIESLCGLKQLDLQVIVDKTADEVKTIPVRDEDKLKAMLEKNPEVITLKEAFTLDFA